MEKRRTSLSQEREELAVVDTFADRLVSNFNYRLNSKLLPRQMADVLPGSWCPVAHIVGFPWDPLFQYSQADVCQVFHVDQINVFS